MSQCRCRELRLALDASNEARALATDALNHCELCIDKVIDHLTGHPVSLAEAQSAAREIKETIRVVLRENA